MKKTGLKYTATVGRGYNRLVSPKNAPLRLLEMGIVKLAGRKSLALPLAEGEAVITLLKGTCTIESSGQKFTIGPRKNIFEDYPWAVYLRGAEHVKLTAHSAVELLVSAAPAAAGAPVIKMIDPSQVIERIVGEDTYQRRVRTIIGEDFPASALLVGETLNEAGKWSSYPPHRHEKDSLPREVKLEEVYYYKLEKPNGFGVQRIYTDDGRIDEAHTVRDGDLCVLPRGYHPVAAAPSSRLYYFWALAGKKRKMRVRVDPNFA